MNDININYTGGYMIIHLDEFFPCKISKLKRLLKVVEKDFMDCETIKGQMVDYCNEVKENINLRLKMLESANYQSRRYKDLQYATQRREDAEKSFNSIEKCRLYYKNNGWKTDKDFKEKYKTIKQMYTAAKKEETSDKRIWENIRKNIDKCKADVEKYNQYIEIIKGR